MDIEEQLRMHFKCTKCNNDTAETKTISASGAGISKLFDIQHNRFVTVTCRNCGYTEMYNPDILKGKDNLGTILDILFGG